MWASTGGSHLAAIGRNKQVCQDPQHSLEVGQSPHFCCSSPGHHPQLLPFPHLSVLDFQGMKSPEDSIQHRGADAAARMCHHVPLPGSPTCEDMCRAHEARHVLWAILSVS